jgi:hypothetical protein
MEDLSLHILDIAENAIDADAGRIEILIEEAPKEDKLVIEIGDDGRGMNPEILVKADDPFYTTRTTRKVGLGLSLLKQAAEETGGSMTIESIPGEGTRVRTVFGHSHIDRKPLGDMAATMTTLVAGHPEIDFIVIHRCDSGEVRINTAELKQDLGPDGLRSPAGLKYIRQTLNILKENSSTWRGESQGGSYGGSRTGTGHTERV